MASRHFHLVVKWCVYVNLCRSTFECELRGCRCFHSLFLFNWMIHLFIYVYDFSYGLWFLPILCVIGFDAVLLFSIIIIIFFWMIEECGLLNNFWKIVFDCTSRSKLQTAFGLSLRSDTWEKYVGERRTLAPLFLRCLQLSFTYASSSNSNK